TKPAGKGSGLGLSMVYGFVRQSGGHIRIQSAPGAGTTVRPYLPRANGNPAPLAARANAIGARGHAPILLVDDGALVRRYVAALAALQAGTQVELLLTDVVMPGGLDGAQLAERARALRPGLRVLFTSGYAENALVHKGRLDPGVQLLSKPYRRQQLAAKVR